MQAEILYIHAAAGASGDMLGGAMAALVGWKREELEQIVKGMGLEGVEIQLHQRRQAGVVGVGLMVKSTDTQPHRHLEEVLDVVGRLGGRARELARSIFVRMAEAEARVHGISPQQVHFHEVGAVDAIVEVGIFCLGLEQLGVEQIISSPLPLGRGWVECAHGELPLPAPAVLELLKGAQVEPWPAAEETVTPTGAAIISAIATAYGPPPPMSLEASATAMGARSSATGRPNILRLMAGRAQEDLTQHELVEISFHVDDMDPEELAIALEQLRQAGAIDVVSWPVAMKKSRTGTMVLVLATRSDSQALARLALECTTTLGVRIHPLKRLKLAREQKPMPSPWGKVRIKLAHGPHGLKLKPEADDVARIAQSTGQPPWRVKQSLIAMAYEYFAGDKNRGK